MISIIIRVLIEIVIIKRKKKSKNQRKNLVFILINSRILTPFLTITTEFIINNNKNKDNKK